MPIYEYRCVVCKNEFERLKPRFEKCDTCPDCGGSSGIMISKSSVHYKCEGFPGNDIKLQGSAQKMKETGKQTY